MRNPILRTLRLAFRLAQHPEQNIQDSIEWAAQQARSRRNFLKTTAQAGVVWGIGGPAAWQTPPLWEAAKKYKIGIVGAGLAGLSAGWHLRRKGVQTTIFEADKRVGGRVRSAKIFGGGDLVTEIGAEFIDTGHQDMLWLAQATDLKMQLMDVETDVFGVRDAFFIENRHHSVEEVLAEFKAFYPRLQADQAKMEGSAAAVFDTLSMAAYIEDMPVSSWVKKLLHAAYIGENGLETGEQSAANLLSVFEIRNERFFPFGSSDERFKVIGGNDQIPQKLAESLRDQIRLEHRLTAIKENSNRSITLTFSENGNTREETFDVVLLSLPFTVLRDVRIDMDLPKLKKQVIQELGYGTNSKFIVETTERSWRKAGYRGYLFNEQVHNGWDSTQMQGNNEGYGTFTCFLGGNSGKNAIRGEETAMLAQYAPELEGAFPGIKNALTGKTELANWPGNPNIRASYTCYKPGQVTRFEGAAFEPVRRLHFAGEHCSTDHWGFMNGAAETGRRFAEKMLRKMKIK